MIINELRELNSLYEKHGTIPKPEDFSGEYYVTAPCFPWISFRHLNHRKEIKEKNCGSNVLLNKIRFGRFELKKDQDSLRIDYDQPENPLLIRKVIDNVKVLPNGRIIGKLFFKIPDRKIFILFFEMKPVK